MSTNTIDSSWSYVNNPFVAISQHSFSKSHRIGNYTTSALFAHKADPKILELYNFLFPIYTAYNNSFISWLVQQGTKMGDTESLHQLIDTIVPNLDDWEFGVRGVYKKSTPQFKAIFPNGHAPFVQGKQDDRISAINALSSTLNGIPALATTATDVAAFAALMNNAFGKQKGNVSTKKVNSNQLETDRLNLADGLYYVLGGLIQINYKTPDKSAAFFDIQTLRNLQQSDFTGRNAPLVIVVIAKRTLQDDYSIILDNTGITPLQFFMSANNTPTGVGKKMVEVPANSLMTVTADMLRENATDAYLCVYNPSATLAGTWELAL